MAWGEKEDYLNITPCQHELCEIYQIYPCGIIDFHLCQQFSVYAEVAESTPLIVDDAVSLTGHRDEARSLAQLRTLQSPKQVPSDGVDEARAFWRAETHQRQHWIPLFSSEIICFVAEWSFIHLLFLKKQH